VATAEKILSNEGILKLFGSADIIPLTLFIFFTIFIFLLVIMLINNRNQFKINKEWSKAINDLSLAINLDMEKDKSTLKEIEKTNDKLDKLSLQLETHNKQMEENGENQATKTINKEGGD